MMHGVCAKGKKPYILSTNTSATIGYSCCFLPAAWALLFRFGPHDVIFIYKHDLAFAVL